MTAKQRSIVALFGALVYALFGLRVLLWSIPSVFITAGVSGSAGLGAVSVGISETLVEFALPAIGSIIVNRMLRAWARSAGERARALHQAQRWSIVLAFVLVIATPIAFAAGMVPPSLAVFSLAGIVWGAQFVLTAALLGMYALRTART